MELEADDHNTPEDSTALRPPRTNVLVAGLPEDFDEARLRALFASYGDVISCKLMLDIESGVSKGYGFVRYVDHADALKVIEKMNGTKMSPSSLRPLTLSLAQHDGTSAIAECDQLYLRNVPLHVHNMILKTVCCEFGEVVECKVLRHPCAPFATEGVSKGVAFVKYKTVVEAQSALKKIHGSRPFGACERPLMARFVEPTEARRVRQSHPRPRGQLPQEALPPLPPLPTLMPGGVYPQQQHQHHQMQVVYYPQPMYTQPPEWMANMPPGTARTQPLPPQQQPGHQFVWYPSQQQQQHYF